MNSIDKHLEKLQNIEKKNYHPLIHKIHKKYNISRKTLFYVKEYGQHAHVSKVILKESLKVLILASIVSSLGGIALESMKSIFASIIPLIVILPVLNDMIGDYGTIMSSRFATMLHQGKIHRHPLMNKEVKKLLLQIFVISIITAFFSAVLALFISYISSYSINLSLAYKIFFIAILDTLILAFVLSLTAIFAGIYFYKKKEDPNNFLIPMTTSIADLGNIAIMSILITLFF